MSLQGGSFAALFFCTINFQAIKELSLDKKGLSYSHTTVPLFFIPILFLLADKICQNLAIAVGVRN